jgi:hypothetical protein
MTIKFKDAVSAEACVQKMNGRFFDGRKVSPVGSLIKSLLPGHSSCSDLRRTIHWQRAIPQIRERSGG